MHHIIRYLPIRLTRLNRKDLLLDPDAAIASAITNFAFKEGSVAAGTCPGSGVITVLYLSSA